MPATARYNVILPLFFFSSARIQEQRSVVSDLAEVKHLGDGVGERIERTLANALSAEPVVFDEPGNRGLVGDAVIHEVLPRPWVRHPPSLSGRGLPEYRHCCQDVGSLGKA